MPLRGPRGELKASCGTVLQLDQTVVHDFHGEGVVTGTMPSGVADGEAGEAG